MNKQKVKEIVKFSLRKNIQNKWFVILNVFLFLIMVISINSQNIKSFLEEKNINLFDDELKIIYIDNDNLLSNSIEKAFEDYDNIEVEKETENNFTVENIDKNIVVEVSPDAEKIITAKIISKEGIDESIYNILLENLNSKRRELFSLKNSISEAELQNLENGTEIERVMLGVNSENSDKKEIVEYVSTMAMYIISIFIFSKIANDISQEKVSKSIEYVLTSVTAKEYLLAKIIGVVLTVILEGIYLLVYFFTANILNNLININSLEVRNSI